MYCNILKNYISRQIYMEKKIKSIYKTISWRILATFVTFLIGWGVSGSVAIGAGIATIEFWAKLILYYLHERIWLRIRI
jgi:uncharacterized membrane protein